MRKEFQLTADELKQLLDACRPVPYMVFGGMAPRSPQENANDAWKRLAEQHGFVWDTVRPIAGKGQECFTAECAAELVESPATPANT